MPSRRMGLNFWLPTGCAPLQVVVIPIAQGAFGHTEEGSRIGQVTGARQLRRPFEKPFGGMCSLGQKSDGGCKDLTTARTSKLQDPHRQVHGIVADGQIPDGLAGPGLMDLVGHFAALGTNAQSLLGSDCKAIVLLVGILLTANHHITRQLQQFRPKRQCLF